jgi:hypothetical protein
MTRTTVRLTLLVLSGSAALLLATAPAFAQSRSYPYGQSQVAPYDDPGVRDGRGYDGRWRQGPGFSAGFRDGVREGRDAARDGRRFDPFRESRYRAANNGYHGRYGPREYYRQDYRDGFRAGYNRGYREARLQSGYSRQRPWDERGGWR